jgi:hypothetical protein
MIQAKYKCYNIWDDRDLVLFFIIPLLWPVFVLCMVIVFPVFVFFVAIKWAGNYEEDNNEQN